MKKVVLLVMAFMGFTFADPSETEIFTANDDTISTTCKPQCRKVSDKFVALVTAFDPKSGITQCSIYPKDDLKASLGLNANTKNTTCIEQTNQTVPISSLSSYNKKYDASDLKYQPGQLTLTKFLAGMVTLDPSLIDFERTKVTGVIELKNPTAIYGTNIAEVKNREEITATADSFNKANLAYYGNIYSNMSRVYSALQYMLLVVIGGFFFSVMAVKNFNNKIERANDNQKILNTLLVPVIVFGTFFIPIPEDSGMNATPIQKIMRAGASLSNDFADRAGVFGSESYMQKLYGSVGAYTVDKEKALEENKKNYVNIIKAYELGYKECKERFPNITSFLNPSDGTDSYNINKKDEKYHFSGCQFIEHKMRAFYTLQRQNDLMLGAVKKNLRNNELEATLKQINDGVNNRNNELGWINSTIIPALAVLVENISIVEDNSVASQIVENNKNNIERSSQDRADENMKERNKDSWWSWGANVKDKMDVVAGDTVGWIMGKMTYMILPGAGDVVNMLSVKPETAEKIANFIPFGKTALGKIAIEKVISFASSALAIVIVVVLYTSILNYIPLTVSIVASALAFLGYIIELAKYFYIAPFVTAFSLTTGRTNKVADFLVTGIALFLKPVLIVIFIYFALFIYGLFNDIFLMYAVEQLSMIREIQSQFWMTVMIGVFEILLKIVGAIGSVYIMWKLIIHAPAWVFKMIGLNDSNASFATEQLGQRLEKYSFQL